MFYPSHQIARTIALKTWPPSGGLDAAKWARSGIPVIENMALALNEAYLAGYIAGLRLKGHHRDADEIAKRYARRIEVLG